MAEWIGIARRARRCYGFDEIALVPGSQTVNPNEVDTTFEFAGKKFKVPILAAAMDGVVDVNFAVEMSRLGGIAVLNLDGLQTRFPTQTQCWRKLPGPLRRKRLSLYRAFTGRLSSKSLLQNV